MCKRNLLIMVYAIAVMLLLSNFAWQQNDVSIVLHYHSSYEGETISKVETGLLWAHSLMGAMLPLGCKEKSLIWNNDKELVMHLQYLGYSPKALNALRTICDSIKNTPEYIACNGIDIARWIMLTLHSTHHYYEICDAAPTLQSFYNKHNEHPQQQLKVMNSMVGKFPRKIIFHVDSNIEKMWFVTHQFSDTNSEINVHEYETIDIMPNSQPRFAIYDSTGALITCADDKYSQAGKPGKCMWCHESKIQPLFTSTADITPGLSLAAFDSMVTFSNCALKTFRSQQSTEIAYDSLQHHTLHELIYIPFMEPSMQRLQHECSKVFDDSIALRLLPPAHVYDEFPFLGKLYVRAVADSIAGINSLRVPLSVREFSPFEPNFLLK